MIQIMDHTCHASHMNFCGLYTYIHTISNTVSQIWATLLNHNLLKVEELIKWQYNIWWKYKNRGSTIFFDISLDGGGIGELETPPDQDTPIDTLQGDLDD